MATREQIMAALFTLVAGAYAWKNAPSSGPDTRRRLKLWGSVDASLRPAVFQFEGGKGTYSWSNDVNTKRVLRPQLFIYINSKDPTTIGASEINTILDALDAALAAPAGPVGRQTLGGLVHSCRIEGDPFSDPGDLDGDGLIVVPVRIVMP